MGQIAKMGKKCAYADIPTSQMILAVYLSGAGKSREIHLIFSKIRDCQEIHVSGNSLAKENR